ncbi:tol-pal system YbgF family protein [Spirochaetota bacterium]
MVLLRKTFICSIIILFFLYPMLADTTNTNTPTGTMSYEIKVVKQNDIFKIKIYSENPNELFIVSKINNEYLIQDEDPYKTNGMLVFGFKAVKAGETFLGIDRYEGTSVERDYISYKLVIKKVKEEKKAVKAPVKKKAEEHTKEKAAVVLIKDLIINKLYDRANTNISLYYRAYPTGTYRTEVSFIEGGLYHTTGDRTNAAAAYRKIITRKSISDEDLVKGYYRLGMLGIETGAFDDASEYFSKIIASFRSHRYYYPAKHFLGVCLKETGKYTEALKLFKEVYRNNKKYKKIDEVLFHMAETYELSKELRNFKKAFSYYDIITEKHPFSAYYKKAVDKKKYLEKNFIDIK